MSKNIPTCYNTFLPGFFLEWDKSLRSKYCMPMEQAGDLQFQTKDKLNSLKPFLGRFQGTAWV